VEHPVTVLLPGEDVKSRYLVNDDRFVGPSQRPIVYRLSDQNDRCYVAIEEGVMQDIVLAYFNGEKQAGLLLIAIGAIGIAGAVLFFQARWGLRSLAITLGVLALAEITLGAGLYLRTDAQVNGLMAQLASDRGRFDSEERARMLRVQRTFVVIEFVELAVIVACAVIAITQKHRSGMTGVALGLLINGAFLLAFDLVAERRGAVYLAAIDARAVPE
jgi:hypothetical protein